VALPKRHNKAIIRLEIDEVVRLLDALGLGLIEAGNPASNPKELEFFRRVFTLRLLHAKLCAFGSTRRKDIGVEEDAGCAALLQADTPMVTVCGKSSALHVEEIIQTSKEQNLAMIEDTCRFFAQNSREVVFDAEHFFDGHALDAPYALETLRAAVRGGARTLVLCDTNGGSFPWDTAEITRVICTIFPAHVIGIHAHDDGGMATAVSCAAVAAGARHVQGTFLGFGERVGNAALSAVIPNLQLKMGHACLEQEQLAGMTETALRLASIANVRVPHSAPYVGARAFAHRAACIPTA